MRHNIQQGMPLNKLSWRKLFKNTLYFGVPALVALSSIIFPIRPFLRQAMVGFMLVWFVAGSWLFATPK
jgi:hypothetical protein